MSPELPANGEESVTSPEFPSSEFPPSSEFRPQNTDMHKINSKPSESELKEKRKSVVLLDKIKNNTIYMMLAVFAPIFGCLSFFYGGAYENFYGKIGSVFSWLVNNSRQKPTDVKANILDVINQNSYKQNRYIDNNNGTITDSKHKIIALKDSNCFGKKSWEDAMSSVHNLSSGTCGLSDSSKPGDWHLPTKDELIIIVEWSKSGQFSNVEKIDYWSSTPFADYASYAWDSVYGHISKISNKNTNYVWPIKNYKKE